MAATKPLTEEELEQAFRDDPELGLAFLHEDYRHHIGRYIKAKAWGLSREDIKDVRAELEELTDVIGYSYAKKLSDKQIGRLCEIYTRRGWTTQNELILSILKTAGDGAAPVIKAHIAKEKAALPAIRKEIERLMPKAANTTTRWRYLPATALKRNIERGIGELESTLDKG